MRQWKWLLMIFGLTGPLWAGSIPAKITYQGTLKQNGIPATGPHSMSFKLTDIGGTAQYGSVVNMSNVPVNQGLFAVQLDFTANGTTPVDWQNIVPYIQVSVDGQSLAPNEPLTSTAYSLMSMTVVDGAITRAKLDASIQTLLLPAGGIMAYGGSAAPSGWLVCNGTAVSRTTYAALFQAIGVTWGAGDGSTTFNLPDLRGRTTIGAGQGPGLTDRALGQNLGEETHMLTTNEMPVHNHGVNDPGHTHSETYNAVGAGIGNLAAPYGIGGATQITGSFDLSTSMTGITIQNAGGGQAHNIMQPSAIVNYIIKY